MCIIDILNISLGISTIPTVRVQRGVLGIGATSHTNGDSIRVHRGSFNIVDSSVHFIDPPKGNTRSRRTDSEIPFVKANFSGRTFLRQDYTTNMLFDDISDTFTGLTTAYDLKVGGAHTSAGIGLSVETEINMRELDEDIFQGIDWTAEYAVSGVTVYTEVSSDSDWELSLIHI